MATNILTPNSPDPVTGLTNSVLGWQLSAAKLADVYAGICAIAKAGYTSQLSTIDIVNHDPPLFAWNFSKAGDQPVVINNEDWCAFDGKHAWVISDDDVSNNMTVTIQ